MKIIKNVAGLALAVFMAVSFGGCADKGLAVNGPVCVDTPNGKVCYAPNVAVVSAPPPALPPPVSYNQPLTLAK